MAKKQKVATLNAQVQGFYGRIIENLQAEITSLKIENENLKTDLRDLEFKTEVYEKCIENEKFEVHNDEELHKALDVIVSADCAKELDSWLGEEAFGLNIFEEGMECPIYFTHNPKDGWCVNFQDSTGFLTTEKITSKSEVCYLLYHLIGWDKGEERAVTLTTTIES